MSKQSLSTLAGRMRWLTALLSLTVINVVDAQTLQWQFASADHDESALSGRRLAYEMSAYQALLSKSGTPLTISEEQSGSGGKRQALEMVDLIKMLVRPPGNASALGDWNLGAQQESALRWKTAVMPLTARAEDDIAHPYRRNGEVLLTVDGVPTHHALRKTVAPGKWAIALFGPAGGFTKVNLSAGTARGAGPMLDAVKGKLPLQHYRCKPQYPSSGNRVFVVQGGGRKPLWINEDWSCGSSGCGVSLDIVFTKAEADAFICS